MEAIAQLFNADRLSNSKKVTLGSRVCDLSDRAQLAAFMEALKRDTTSPLTFALLLGSCAYAGHRAPKFKESLQYFSSTRPLAKVSPAIPRPTDRPTDRPNTQANASLLTRMRSKGSAQDSQDWSGRGLPEIGSRWHADRRMLPHANSRRDASLLPTARTAGGWVRNRPELGGVCA